MNAFDFSFTVIIFDHVCVRRKKIGSLTLESVIFLTFLWSDCKKRNKLVLISSNSTDIL